MIENFLDFVDKFGFVPNGARIYYLNRSQPPLLTLMVKAYIEYANDTQLLNRALPLLEKELQFWAQNNTIKVTSPWTGNIYNLSHYSVLNNQPRPESFREDYITANNVTYFSVNGSQYPVAPLNDSQKADVYAELASGAESGIDYSSRWLRTPLDAVLDTSIPLRSLGLRETIPVDLNSVLYASEIAIANFHLSLDNKTAYKHYQSLANQRVNGMYDLMFNETEFRYFDYNMSSKTQNVIGWTGNSTNLTQGVRFYPQQFWPFWLGAVPETLSDPEAVEVVFQPVAQFLDRNAGAIGASNLNSGILSVEDD
jgi:alpha,alpha-trehalase